MVCRKGNGITLDLEELLERFCGPQKVSSTGENANTVAMSDDSAAPTPTSAASSSQAASQAKHSDILLCVEADNCVAKHLEQRCRLRGLKHTHFGTPSLSAFAMQCLLCSRLCLHECPHGTEPFYAITFLRYAPDFHIPRFLASHVLNLRSVRF